MAYQFQFDREKCVGCFACHTACLDAHHDAGEEQARSFRTVEKVKTAKFEKIVCPGCVHCGKCMEVCPALAIDRDEETGLILTDPELCIGCRGCEDVCPMGVIHFDKDGKMGKCDGCIDRLREGREPACVRVCPMDAISIEKV